MNREQKINLINLLLNKFEEGDRFVTDKKNVRYIRENIVQSIFSDSELLKQSGWVKIEDVQLLIIDYVKTEGCSCCSDYEGHKIAAENIGKALGFMPYSDGSGYDLMKPNPQKINP